MSQENPHVRRAVERVEFARDGVRVFLDDGSELVGLLNVDVSAEFQVSCRPAPFRAVLTARVFPHKKDAA